MRRSLHSLAMLATVFFAVPAQASEPERVEEATALEDDSPDSGEPGSADGPEGDPASPQPAAPASPEAATGEQVAQATPPAQSPPASTPAPGQPAATVAKAAGKPKKDKGKDESNAAVQNALGALAGGGQGLPFGAIIRLSNNVGYGTFVQSEFNRRPLYDISLNVNPFFDVAKGHRLSANISITKNIVSNSAAGSTDVLALTREGQTTVSDLILQYVALNVVQEPVTGLRLNLGAGVVLPTSLGSQLDSLYLGTRAQATLLGIWDWFVFAYTFRITKNFHEFSHAAVDGGGDTPICISRDAADTNTCIPGGLANAEWLFLNSFFTSFNITDSFSFNLSFALFNILTYDVNPSDEFAAANSQTGRGQRDIMLGSFGFNYQVNSYLAASIGATTFQAPFTPDNKSFRFPFFSTNPDNSTVFDFTLTGTF